MGVSVTKSTGTTSACWLSSHSDRLVKQWREWITLPTWSAQNKTDMWWSGWRNLQDSFPSPLINRLQSAGFSSQLYSLELTQPSKAWTMWSGISGVQQAGCQKNLFYSYFNVNFYELGKLNQAVIWKEIAGRKYLEKKKREKETKMSLFVF